MNDNNYINFLTKFYYFDLTGLKDIRHYFNEACNKYVIQTVFDSLYMY